MPVLRRKWFQILASGLVFLYILEKTLMATHNLNYVPSVILLGSFLVPVTFVVYLYETLPDWEVPFPPIAICFLGGGVVGTVIAGSLEFDVIRTLDVLPTLMIGIIEEGAKLIFPLAFYFIGRYRSEAAGILLGTSCAMGFAALETMGYSFVTLLRSNGNLLTLDSLLFVRGVLSPAEHAAWTGIVCAALWRERERAGRALANGKVIGAFITAVLLHSFWDVFNLMGGDDSFLGFLVVEGTSMCIVVISLTLFSRRVREAKILSTRQLQSL